MKRKTIASSISLAVLVAGLGITAGAQQPDSAADRDPWPRQVPTPSGLVTIYQPQVDAWTGNQLTFHAAVAIQARDSAPEVYGVIFASARTEVDKSDRMVTLEDFAITKVKFPAHADSAASYLKALHPVVPTTARTISLDRLQASLAVVQNMKQVRKAPVQNAPPTIYTSTVPAILVLIDGAPVLRPVPNMTVQRVINTGVLIVFDQYTYYLHVFDGWMQAVQLNGPWVVSYQPPAELAPVLQWAMTQPIQLLTGTSPDAAEPAPSLWTSTVPVIYASTTPAALINTQGIPDYSSIPGTDLLYVTNTSGHIFEYIDNQQAYVLLGGRWFTAPTLKGPWQFVAPANLPKDFLKIPLDSPAEPVLASIPGTPQAQEAVIENSIPQTASINRFATMPAAQIDGNPQFLPIAETSLQYVANASLPIILTPSGSFYAVYNGVWFVGSTAYGPWAVALSVPASLYTIPPSSPLYYVTYVQVYGYNANVVFVGYTPGYYGTVVTPYGVVVYGTGYTYVAWVGTVYYPPPQTYGYGATMVWTPYAGWTVVYGMGYCYGGTAVMVTYGGAMWGVHPYYGPAYYGGTYGKYGYEASGPGGWMGTTGNVYTQNGSRSMVTNTSGAYNKYTGNGWSQKYGSSYNSATGVASAGQRTTVGNAYTGNYQSYSSGTATNTKTGATATGYTNTSGNAYTGQKTTTGQAEVTGANGKTTSVEGASTNNASAVKVNNNVYGDVNGNVYKSNDNGSWSQYNGSSTKSSASSASSGGWSNYNGSSSSAKSGSSGSSMSSLNSQASSRSSGASRSNSYSSYGGGGGGGGRR